MNLVDYPEPSQRAGRSLTDQTLSHPFLLMGYFDLALRLLSHVYSRELDDRDSLVPSIGYITRASCLPCDIVHSLHEKASCAKGLAKPMETL